MNRIMIENILILRSTPHLNMVLVLDIEEKYERMMQIILLLDFVSQYVIIIKITAINKKKIMQKIKNNKPITKIQQYQQCQQEYGTPSNLMSKQAYNKPTTQAQTNKKQKQQYKNTNIVYSTTNGSNSTYEDMLKLCRKYRKQNQQLQYRNRQLQNTIKLMQSKSSITQLLYHNNTDNSHNQNTSKEVDRVRYLEDEYKLYKDNIYKQSKKQIKNLYKFVDYLYLCFQQYVQTNNSKYGQVIRTINQKGIKNFLTNKKNMNNVNCLDKFIQLIQQQIENPVQKPSKTQPQQQSNSLNYSSTQSNTYLQIFNNQIYLTRELEVQQTQLLRKKIKQLNNVIQTLIKLYREQLSLIIQTAKGTSSAITQQLKQCVYKNCKLIMGEKNEQPKPKTNSSINQSWNGTFNNHKLQQKIGKNCKSSKNSFSKLNKRLSLGESMNITQNYGKNARPPTPIKKYHPKQIENKSRLNISCSMGVHNKQNKKDNSNAKYTHANLNQLRGQKNNQQKYLNIGNPTPKNSISQIKSQTNSVTKTKIKY